MKSKLIRVKPKLRIKLYKKPDNNETTIVLMDIYYIQDFFNFKSKFKWNTRNNENIELPELHGLVLITE
jgi:hypothetical protein